MNTPNPLVPQGAFQQNQKTSAIRVAVFAVVAAHAVFFAGILMQGCKREGAAGQNTGTAATPTNATSELAPLDPDFYRSASELPRSSTNTLAQTPAPQAPNLASQAVSESDLPPASTGTVSSLPPFGGGLQPLTSRETSAPSVGTTEHTISRGDTLAKVAKANGVTVAAINKANPGLDARRLKIGQKINIPAPAAPAASATASGTGSGNGQVPLGELPSSEFNNANAGNVHVVKSGDNLTRIARQHRTTVGAIKTANNLRTDRVVVGQKLKIPASTGSL